MVISSSTASDDGGVPPGEGEPELGAENDLSSQRWGSLLTVVTALIERCVKGSP